jgi:hypothetical protein
MVNVGPRPAAKLVPVVEPYDTPFLRKIRINHPSCILPLTPVHLANAPENFQAIWGNPLQWTFASMPAPTVVVTPVEWPENMNVFE